ncbi:hypothetical protein P4O66_017655 [Electrophorus voltai]|uniref:Out at first protein homolog n=1 Tax=Electrophorus voltai TaxID=2609070 RepID=A0AAD9DL42_9TELE|nr:hypothetical protein P4O66_017655 [Electrophorus voltai]
MFARCLLTLSGRLALLLCTLALSPTPGFSSELKVRVRLADGQVTEELLQADSQRDSVTLEFKQADGTLITFVADFKQDVKIFRALILGELERGQSQYQALCFITRLSRNEIIPSDSMARLRQVSPEVPSPAAEEPTHRPGCRGEAGDGRAQHERGGERDAGVADQRPHPQHVQRGPRGRVHAGGGRAPLAGRRQAFPCTSLMTPSETPELDVDPWGLTEPVSLRLLSLCAGVEGSTFEVLPRAAELPGLPSCGAARDLWEPCTCSYALRLEWYPCLLKYCRSQEGGTALRSTTYKCGIRSCSKGYNFTFYTPHKQLCLWEEEAQHHKQL